jgi:hypothetical protein
MNHKFTLACIATSCAFLAWTTAPAQQVDWIKQIGGTSADNLLGSCEDHEGGIYVTGTLAAGGIPPGGYVANEWFSVAGAKDIYLARFLPSGILDWVVLAGGPTPSGVAEESEFGANVIFDSITNTLIAQGGYQSQLSSFGKDHSLSGRGQFVARYSTSGVCEWVRGVSWGRPNDITVGQNGEVYAMGYRHTWFDDNFLVKYDMEGNEIWTKLFGSGATGKLVMDHDTLVLATTVEDGDELFGGSFSAIASGDAVILRLDTSATIISMQQYGSDSLAWITDMVRTPDGTLLIAGAFYHSLLLPADTLYSEHEHEVRFLIKADRHAVPIWIKVFEIQDHDGPGSWAKVSIAQDSTVHLLIDLRGALVVGTDTLLPNASNDLLILRYSWNGDLEATYHEGRILLPRVILSSSDGSVIFGGDFSSPPLLIGEGLVSNGSSDAFIARMTTISTSAAYKSSPSGDLLIYANPNDGTCTIELPQELRWTQGLMLYIHDAQGRLVQSIPLRQQEGRVALDIRAQAKGMYPVQVTDGRQRYSGTIVFE